MTRARGSHFFRSADVTFYEIRRWRERQRGDFVTSNGDEERALRAVLSKLIIVRHQNASHVGSQPELALL